MCVQKGDSAKGETKGGVGSKYFQTRGNNGEKSVRNKWLTFYTLTIRRRMFLVSYDSLMFIARYGTVDRRLFNPGVCFLLTGGCVTGVHQYLTYPFALHVPLFEITRWILGHEYNNTKPEAYAAELSDSFV